MSFEAFQIFMVGGSLGAISVSSLLQKEKTILTNLSDYFF